MATCVLLILGVNAVAALVLDSSSRAIDGTKDPRIDLPAFTDKQFAKRFFSDWYQTTAAYHAYEGFRLKPFSSDTVNINEFGLRCVPGAPRNAARSIWMFGGSTMWGTGVSDSQTIPGLVQESMHDEVVLNYGQSGYLSMQNLVILVKNLSGGLSPNTVVFYDGVNDIFHYCSGSATVDGHAGESVMRQALDLYTSQKPGRSKFTKDATYGHILRLGALLRGNSPTTNVEEMPPDRENISAVTAVKAADKMWRNWKMAKMLVESHNGRFIAILQPVSTVSRSGKDYLAPTPQWDEWYTEGYEHLRQLIAEEGYGWAYDLSGVLDQVDNVFIDWCHLNAEGNRVIADRIQSLLRNEASGKSNRHSATLRSAPTEGTDKEN